VSELAKRIAFSLIAAPAVVVAVWFGGAALAALLSIAAGLGAWEFYRLAKSCGEEPMWLHGIIGAALVPLGVHAQYLGLSVPPLGVLVLVVLELLAVALLWRGGRGKPLEVVGITILGIFYIGGMLSYAYALRYHPYAIGAAAGAAVVVLPLFCTWATDIGGYVFGRWLGKRKLMPTVSPGKTVAGAIGGIATSIVICLAYVQFVLRPVGSLTSRGGAR
jgi:phosphatidate cytidylyltransferase